MANNQFFHDLNKIYRKVGTWKKVAIVLCVDARTIRKWWNGETEPSDKNVRWASRVCARHSSLLYLTETLF